MLHYETVVLCTGEPFRKMQDLNRYRVATANGPLLLSVPVQGGRGVKLPLGEVLIDNSTDWQKQHWRSLFSAYGRAPFFDHYGPQLESILVKRNERLADLNFEALEWICLALRLKTTFILQHEQRSEPIYKQASSAEGEEKEKRYGQVFEDRNGFLAGLSIIDLIMNEGPAAVKLLL